MKNQAKLIRKLRLKKGCKYLLFIPRSVMPMNDVVVLGDLMNEEGYGNIIVSIETSEGIKVIEQNKNDQH